MHKIVILLGSNQGESKALILKAKQLLEIKIGHCLKLSSIYETEAWGFKSETPFLNQVLIYNTKLNAETILKIALEIEKELGRTRNGSAYASRTMDIDLLFYDDKIIQTENLQIPHPRLHLRRFSLEPLDEVMPNFVHPELNKTISELLNSCDDHSKIIKLKN